MERKRQRRSALVIYGAPIVLLVATVPMFSGNLVVFGLPGWAVVSLGATLAYALAVALALDRCFQEGEGGATDGSDGAAAGVET